MVPALSVVIGGFGRRQATWDRVRDCLQAIAAQTAGPVEVVLCRIPELPGEAPQDLAEITPNLKILQVHIEDEHARRTFGVRAAAAPIVALLDADCMPQSGWAAALLETFEFYPEVAVVHGRMKGETVGWIRRFLDPKIASPAKVTATNNAAYRREAYLDYPLPEGSGARAVRLQSAAMRRAGYRLWQEPAMVALRDRRGLAKAAGLSVENPAAITR
ncbi:MAG: hypothetical protein RL328_804 [Acidobacteriota bacterium]|jgi:hypothetical protein